MSKKTTHGNNNQTTDKALALLLEQLAYLKLSSVTKHYDSLAVEAGRGNWGHVKYLAQLVALEADRRQENTIQRRVKAARFAVLKTLDQFRWNWSKKINKMQIKDLFRLQFVEQHVNVILLGGVGLGKTHLATALAYHACLNGIQVLFTNTIDVINTLVIAKAAGQLKPALRKYLKPTILVLDELGYLPIDKLGADLLFQIISGRYEMGSTIITTNRAFQDWPEIFNNDSTLTAALLDRLLHHGQTVVIEGSSFRMKDQVEI